MAYTAWAVDRGTKIFRYDQSTNTWSLWNEFTGITAGDWSNVYAFSENDVWAFFSRNTGYYGGTTYIRRWNGTSWVSFTISNFKCRYVYSPDDASNLYIAGGVADNAQVYKFNGSGFTLVFNANWASMYEYGSFIGSATNKIWWFRTSTNLENLLRTIGWNGTSWAYRTTSGFNSYYAMTLGARFHNNKFYAYVGSSAGDEIWSIPNTVGTVTWTVEHAAVGMSSAGNAPGNRFWIAPDGKMWCANTYGSTLRHYNGATWSTKNPGGYQPEVFNFSGNINNEVWCCGRADSARRVWKWNAVSNNWTAYDLTLGLGGATQVMDVFTLYKPNPDAPVLQNQNPAPDQSNVPITSNIILEIVDLYLNDYSVSIDVNSNAAWFNDTQQAGFTVLKTPITDGYRYNIDPDNFLIPGDIRIDAYAYDYYGNVLDSYYTFTTVAPDSPYFEVDSSPRTYNHPYPLSDYNIQGNFDGVATDGEYLINRGLEIGTSPYLTSRHPTPDETAVQPDTLIGLDIIDDDTNLSPETILIHINGTLAYDGYFGFYAPFNGVDSYNASVVGGEHVTLDYTGLFDSYQEVVVSVYAQDDLGNELNTDYSFRIEDLTGVEFGNIEPTPNSGRVDKNQIISVDLFDRGVGVDPSTIDAYVNNILVYRGSTSTFYYPYNGPESEVVSTVVDGYAGYTLKLDKISSYRSHKHITVRIVGYDKEGN